jgi:hypothetical protein
MSPDERDTLLRKRRREDCLILLESWKGGETNLDRVLDQVVEIWTGNAERIVRVGETPRPEIQS